jgi:hypothetical protein
MSNLSSLGFRILDTLMILLLFPYYLLLLLLLAVPAPAQPLPPSPSLLLLLLLLLPTALPHVILHPPRPQIKKHKHEK